MFIVSLNWPFCDLTVDVLRFELVKSFVLKVANDTPKRENHHFSSKTTGVILFDFFKHLKMSSLQLVFL